jgi:hypothetical protein
MMILTGRMLRLLITMVVVVSTTACVSMTPRSPDRLVGCYYFERDVVADTLRLPWGIRLLPDTLAGWPAIQQLPDVRRAVTLVGPEQTASYPFGYWRLFAEDSVEIGYPAGGGLVLSLAADTTHLTGTVRAVGDAVALGETLSRATDAVSLMRARCP